MAKAKTNQTKNASQTVTNEQKPSVKPADSTAHIQAIPLLPSAAMDDIIASVKNSMSDFEDIANASMTDA